MRTVEEQRPGTDPRDRERSTRLPGMSGVGLPAPCCGERRRGEGNADRDREHPHRPDRAPKPLHRRSIAAQFQNAERLDVRSVDPHADPDHLWDSRAARGAGRRSARGVVESSGASAARRPALAGRRGRVGRWADDSVWGEPAPQVRGNGARVRVARPGRAWRRDVIAPAHPVTRRARRLRARRRTLRRAASHRALDGRRGPSSTRR